MDVTLLQLRNNHIIDPMEWASNIPCVSLMRSSSYPKCKQWEERNNGKKVCGSQPTSKQYTSNNIGMKTNQKFGGKKKQIYFSYQHTHSHILTLNRLMLYHTHGNWKNSTSNGEWKNDQRYKEIEKKNTTQTSDANGFRIPSKQTSDSFGTYNGNEHDWMAKIVLAARECWSSPRATNIISAGVVYFYFVTTTTTTNNKNQQNSQNNAERASEREREREGMRQQQ